MVDSGHNDFSIVISGSFRKHYSDIRETIRRFELLGLRVLSPKHSSVVNPGEEFALLEGDETSCPKDLEREHLNAIRHANALYLFNAGGYIGPSSAMEVGWALALGKPIFAKEASSDATLKYFAGEPATPEEVKASLLSGKTRGSDRLTSDSSLRVLQAYVCETLAQRGFNNETVQDKVLLMLEEFGELAKALRKRIGLKVDKDKGYAYTEVRYELADIFVYLLDLANKCEIDLYDAFREKERENASRRWDSA